MRDGKEQQERDEWFARPGLDTYPMHAASESFRGPLMGYDAFEEVEKVWGRRRGRGCIE